MVMTRCGERPQQSVRRGYAGSAILLRTTAAGLVALGILTVAGCSAEPADTPTSAQVRAMLPAGHPWRDVMGGTLIDALGRGRCASSPTDADRQVQAHDAVDHPSPYVADDAPKLTYEQTLALLEAMDAVYCR